jgi:hypothetical protein
MTRHQLPAVAGPEACPMDEFARKFLAASGDQRKVIADVKQMHVHCGVETD